MWSTLALPGCKMQSGLFIAYEAVLLPDNSVILPHGGMQLYQPLWLCTLYLGPAELQQQLPAMQWARTRTSGFSMLTTAC